MRGWSEPGDFRKHLRDVGVGAFFVGMICSIPWVGWAATASIYAREFSYEISTYANLNMSYPGSMGGTAAIGINCVNEQGRVETGCNGLRDIMTGEATTVCTVNGIPYTPDMSVGPGAHVNLFWHDAESGANVLMEGGVMPIPKSTSTDVFQGYAASVYFPQRYYGSSDPINVECLTDLSNTGVPITEGLSPTGRSARIITVKNITNFSISSPRPIVSPPGREVSTTFQIVGPVFSFPFLWRIEQPCADWNPYLKIDGVGEQIRPNEDSASTLWGITPVTAYFTPTEMGEFSCVGTFTFLVD